MKNELNKRCETSTATIKTSATCRQLHIAASGRSLNGDTRWRVGPPDTSAERCAHHWFHPTVVAAAKPIATTVKTNVSLVAYISPNPTPVSAAHPAWRVCWYRHPDASASNVKKTSNISWMK